MPAKKSRAKAPIPRQSRTRKGRMISQAVEVVNGYQVMGTISRLCHQPNQSPEQFRRWQLETTLGVIEAWRAYLAEKTASTEQATKFAYLANAYKRELWPETKPLVEFRTFLCGDALAIVNDVRDGILRELTREIEPVAKPGTCPLSIEGGTVHLHGFMVPLGFTSEKIKDALAFLGELIASPGNWKSSPEIGKATGLDGVRFDRIYRGLPQKIKPVLESGGPKGFRIKLALLA